MVTIVDIVDEDDNGFEVVPPPERVPEMYSMQPKYSILGLKRYVLCMAEFTCNMF